MIGASSAGAVDTSAVTFTPGSTVSYATSTWTVAAKSAAGISPNGTITIAMPAGFTWDTSSVVTFATGFAGGAACAATTAGSAKTSITVTLPSGCSAGTTPYTVTVAGVVNPGAASYAAAGFTVKTVSGDTATATGSAITLSGAVTTPTITASGAGYATIQFTTDMSATEFQVTGVNYTSNAATNSCVGFTIPSASLGDTGTYLGDTGTCTITGLTSGQIYRFFATPLNDVAPVANTISTYVSITLSPALTAPSMFLAGSSSATDPVGHYQEWAKFTADGTGVLYTVYYGTSATKSSDTAVGCTVGNSVTPLSGTQGCMVTGLSSGQAYYFWVAANVADVASTSSDVTELNTGSTAALTAKATAGSGGVATVSFAADGIATTYTVTPNSGTGSCTVTNVTPPTGLQSCVVSGLSNGSPTFTVLPSGGGTLSVVSAASTAIAASTRLATPTVVNVTPSATLGNGVAVSFVADGLSTVYTVSAVPVATGVVSQTLYCIVANSVTPPTGAQTCTVYGLTAGTAYSFIVTPNGANLDPATASALSAQIRSTPNYPNIPTAANNASITGAADVTVTFDGIATSYLVTAYDSLGTAASTCLLQYASAPAISTKAICTTTGLKPGKSYTFTVTPSGGLETSQESLASDHGADGEALTILGAALATPTVSNTWNTSAGRSQIVSFVADGVGSVYTATAYAGGVATTHTCFIANSVTPPTGAQSCTVKGLAAGTYTYVVTVTGNGDTAAQSAASAALTTSGEISVSSVVSAGSGSVVVSWTSDGVATAYTATAYAGGVATTHNCIVSSTTALAGGTQSCTITGLTNGSIYNFSVTPTGGYSTSTFPGNLSPSFTVGITALAPPTLTWTASNKLTATFTADGVAGLYTVFAVEASPVLGGGSATCTVGNSTTPLKGVVSCDLTVFNGDSYVAMVSPSSNGDTSASSVLSSIPVLAAQYSAPGAPAVTATALTSTTVSVAFTAPVVTGGSVIGGYLISGTSTDGTSSLVCGAGALTAGTVVCTGAKPGTTYKISVYAGGPFGNSAAGTASVTTPAATLLTVGASFTKGTATLTASAKAALTTLVSSLHDGASITIRGWGATKALATARANAVASFIMSAGAAVHTTVIGIVSKASDAKVYQTA